MSNFRRKLMIAAILGSTNTDIVKDGLILHLDAKNRGSNPSIWKDLTNGYEFNLTNVDLKSDSVTFKGTTDSMGLYTNTNLHFPDSGTFEIVVKRNKNQNGVWFASSCGRGEEFAVGPYSGGLILSGASKPLLKLPYSDKIQSISAMLESITVNGVKNSETYGSDFWTGNGSGQITIGRRMNYGGNGLPDSIYCIRIYNRKLTDEERMNNYIHDKEYYNI